MTDTAPQTPPPAPAAQPVSPPVIPGRTLGIVGLILTFFVSLIGLILSAVARSQSKKAGYSNTPATVGIVLGIIFLVVQIIGIVIAIIAFADIAAQCAGLGNGVHHINGVTYTCS
jgi:TRAP-type C4-dicarboxylate transport system permease small subunit